MSNTKNDRVVLKLGGHLLFDPAGKINIDYLKKLTPVIEQLKDVIENLVIVIGGGQIARRYIETARIFSKNNSSLDIIGIKISQINAMLLSIISNNLPTKIPETLQEVINQISYRKIIFTGGFQPGQSTTTVSALIAEAINADLLIIATDVEGIYDKDPRKYSDAILFREITIDTLKKIFNENPISAGEYKLLDQYTIKILERAGIKTVILNGKNPQNIIKVIRGERIGTLIKTYVK